MVCDTVVVVVFGRERVKWYWGLTWALTGFLLRVDWLGSGLGRWVGLGVGFGFFCFVIIIRSVWFLTYKDHFCSLVKVEGMMWYFPKVHIRIKLAKM